MALSVDGLGHLDRRTPGFLELVLEGRNDEMLPTCQLPQNASAPSSSLIINIL